MITHRLYNIVKADKIIYLEHGSIEGMGTHAVLYYSNSVYRNLFNNQN